jgi:hypothetical protein
VVNTLYPATAVSFTPTTVRMKPNIDDIIMT